jgi:hypothetical protein
MKQTDEKGNPLTYWGGLEEQTKCYCGHTTTCDCIPKEEPKKETLEEAFDRIFDSLDYILFDFCSFEQGAKWQQEQICNHNYNLTSEQGHRVIKCSKCNHTQPI